jgi:hypothetical protein
VSDEFGFQMLSKKLSAHRRSPGLSDPQTAECLSRISVLEERTGQHERQLAALQSGLSLKLRRFETDLARFSSELDAFLDTKKSITSFPAAVAPPSDTSARPPSAIALARRDSLIVGEIPPLFEKFREKRFNLLSRSSHDVFTVKEFHRRCDRRMNTLTLIADTEGNVFGCFTPVKWESRKWNGKSGEESNTRKSDNNLRSFLFTLNNPHGIPPRKFVLKAERKQYAMYCNSTRCAVLGSGCDILVSDNCNTNRESYTKIGTRWSTTTYENDTTFEDFFTAAKKFTVKEIEVFEIAD